MQSLVRSYIMLTTLLNTLQGFTPAHWISIAALVLSLTSLILSARAHLLDRPKLNIEAQRYQSDEEPGYIEVKATNVGRRPIFLSVLCGTDLKGTESGSYFDYGGPGIKLAEHEFKSFKVTHIPRGKDQFNAAIMNEDDILYFDQMWIKDSLGKRHEVPRMTILLQELRADYMEWCGRTGYWKTSISAPPLTKQDS